MMLGAAAPSYEKHDTRNDKNKKEKKKRDQSDGQGPGRASSACIACRKAKVRCGQGQPCPRCSKKGLVCTYGEKEKDTSPACTVAAEGPAAKVLRLVCEEFSKLHRAEELERTRCVAIFRHWYYGNQRAGRDLTRGLLDRLVEIMGLTVDEISQDAHTRSSNKNQVAQQMIEQAGEQGYLPFTPNKSSHSGTDDPYLSLNPLGSFVDSTSAIMSIVNVEAEVKIFANRRFQSTFWTLSQLQRIEQEGLPFFYCPRLTVNADREECVRDLVKLFFSGDHPKLNCSDTIWKAVDCCGKTCLGLFRFRLMVSEDGIFFSIFCKIIFMTKDSKYVNTELVPHVGAAQVHNVRDVKAPRMNSGPQPSSRKDARKSEGPAQPASQSPEHANAPATESLDKIAMGSSVEGFQVQSESEEAVNMKPFPMDFWHTFVEIQPNNTGEEGPFKVASPHIPQYCTHVNHQQQFVYPSTSWPTVPLSHNTWRSTTPPPISTHYQPQQPLYHIYPPQQTNQQAYYTYEIPNFYPPPPPPNPMNVFFSQAHSGGPQGTAPNDLDENLRGGWAGGP